MLKQGSDFHFEISVFRDNRGRDNNNRLYILYGANASSINTDQLAIMIIVYTVYIKYKNFNNTCINNNKKKKKKKKK